MLETEWCPRLLEQEQLKQCFIEFHRPSISLTFSKIITNSEPQAWWHRCSNSMLCSWNCSRRQLGMDIQGGNMRNGILAQEMDNREVLATKVGKGQMSRPTASKLNRWVFSERARQGGQGDVFNTVTTAWRPRVACLGLTWCLKPRELRIFRRVPCPSSCILEPRSWDGWAISGNVGTTQLSLPFGHLQVQSVEIRAVFGAWTATSPRTPRMSSGLDNTRSCGECQRALMHGSGLSQCFPNHHPGQCVMVFRCAGPCCSVTCSVPRTTTTILMEEAGPDTTAKRSMGHLVPSYINNHQAKKDLQPASNFKSQSSTTYRRTS